MDESLLDSKMTDLSTGGFQSLLDIAMMRNFKVGNFEIASKDWECTDDERFVGGTMLEFVVGVNGVPDDDDAEKTGMSGHQARVYGFASRGSAMINLASQIGGITC